MSWQGYPLTHMDGFAAPSEPMIYKIGAVAYPRGHILHDFLEARVFPRIVGPVGRGRLQYTAMWKTAQRMTRKPVKFGTILPELLAASVADDYYKDPIERTWAFSDALNEELNELADAGCPVIQMEEPQIHMVPVRGKTFGKLDVDDLVKIFNNTVKGLRSKTEVWCHTCWGNPSQQRIFRDVQSYQPTLEALDRVDADALTFETCSSGTGDLKAIGEVIKDKKVVIGVIDHHTLQVERPDDIAALIREALEHIPPERLIISSDCGMGREGMGRRHADLQDGGDGARHQHRAQGARAAGGGMPRRRAALLADRQPVRVRTRCCCPGRVPHRCRVDPAVRSSRGMERRPDRSHRALGVGLYRRSEGGAGVAAGCRRNLRGRYIAPRRCTPTGTGSRAIGRPCSSRGNDSALACSSVCTTMSPRSTVWSSSCRSASAQDCPGIRQLQAW